MSYPDLPFDTEFSSHRIGSLTVAGAFGQATAALHAARTAIGDLETTDEAGRQFGLIRAAVIEMRRSTFMLQKLSSRVEGWGEWWTPMQDAMKADPLMGYFNKLRSEIEKEGLLAGMAELVDISTGTVVGDVACGEDEHGIWVSGQIRRGDTGAHLRPGEESSPERLVLRNIRLPDPPTEHLGQLLDDFRFAHLAGLGVDFLHARVYEPTRTRFATTREPS